MRRLPVARLSRWVWLINGILLLGALATAGVVMLVGWLMYGRAPAPAEVAADSTPRAARPAGVRYDAPVPIPGSRVSLVLMRSGRGLPSGPLPSGAAYRAAGEVVNVGFLLPDGTARLLLDRPARIQWISYPGAPDWLAGPLEPSAGPPRIAYAIASDSTGPSLFVSGLDGTGLRRVLPDGLRVQAVRALPGGAALVAAAGEVGQRAFLLEGDSLRPFAALDSLAVTAARIAGGG